MSSKVFSFSPFTARRIPDPNFKVDQNTERHIFVMNVRSLPLELPNDANARDPNIAKKVYQEVRKNLLNEQTDIEINTFHLRNKGIIIIADSVVQKNDHEYEVKISEGKGICDGGHTYQLISDHIKAGDLPESQYVNVEIRTGIRDEWITPIAGGLNTAVQVTRMSLQDLGGKFNFIQKKLGPALSSKIAWSENDDGIYDARDLIALMNMFSIEKPSFYPIDEPKYPKESYYSKEKILEKFGEKTDSFMRIQGILPDILTLHDTISFTAGSLYKEAKRKDDKKSNFGNFRWVVNNPKGIEFPFIDKKGTQALTFGALYPILGAFRNFVQTDLMGNMEWKVPFDRVIKAWEDLAEEILDTTVDVMVTVKDPNGLGKANFYWGNIFNIVKGYEKSM
jgi:hypothetical protein